MKDTYRLVKNILKDKKIKNIENFSNEINSIDFIEIIAEIEKKFDIKIEIQML